MTTTEPTTDPRRQRGMVIAATMKVVRLKHGAWRVPSQSFVGNYTVWNAQAGKACSCPDFEERQQPCKHIFAVQYTLFQETREDLGGGVQVTTTTATRVTYSQDWPAYNAAQTTEKATFLRLLHGLCANVPEPVQTKGRPRLPLADMIFAGAFKVYSTVSGRRFMVDLKNAAADGYLTKAPHYNSIFNYLEMPELTPIIRGLIAESAMPLKAVETDFAADSTGFGTCRSFHYYDMRYGSGQGQDQATKRDWLKLHAMIGCRTHVVTSVEVTDRRQHDTTQFVPLLTDTARTFDVFKVYADKAYSSGKNLDAVEAIGAEPFIPFAVNTTGKGGNATFKRLFHLFSANQEAFLAVYHRRSNVESAFSSMKRKFGDRLRSKTPVAQVNEVLLKVLAHNLVMLVHAMHELRMGGATFWAETPAAQEITL